ncbi:hypothetical protein C6P40_004971 [Pichia californica]|uniref:Fatty acid desaturase domain-containing protein n=1 Tax=Pichia californica TaxID=460514 RepID=A0A9P6WNY0_9ASCO|nr:hypothetical protein C6P42_005332 [[Candida] californica]KAG0689473.1 hypothetical protein C6P40_004971 [[Candida] californica]
MATATAATTSVEDSSSTATKRGSNSASTKQKVTANLYAKDLNGKDFKAPDYTIAELISVIPKDCFKRDLIKSLSFVFRDIFFMILFGYIASTYIPMIPSKTLRFFAWSTYCIVESFPMVGLWILAHECGHQAFSEYGWVNDFVGWILHSYTGNPYFSWKFSHRKHHQHTGHIDKDMVFVPKRTKDWKKSRGVMSLSELTADSPLSSIWTLLIQQVVGFQTYLMIDATGQPHPELQDKWYQQFFASHFNPVAPIFDKGDFWFIIISDIGIAIVGYVVYQWIQIFGGFNCLVHWFIPYLLVNHWIVFLTFLQHTDITLPHYEDNEWNFARGAAATIDREFGFVGWFFFHDIIETHVLHHYVSRIPFYNARKATDAIKKFVGNDYRYSDENMFITLWKSLRQCEFVEGNNGILMYRNHNGFGATPLDE